MTDEKRPRVELRAVMDDETRRRQVRQLFMATAACDVLVVAIVLVGVASDWPWWVLVAVLVLPVGVGAYALRAAVVLNRTAGGEAG